MPGANRLAYLVKKLGSGRHGLTSYRFRRGLRIGGDSQCTKRWFDLDRFAGKERQEVGESALSAGHGPVPAFGMPLTSLEALDLCDPVRVDRGVRS